MPLFKMWWAKILMCRSSFANHFHFLITGLIISSTTTVSPLDPREQNTHPHLLRLSAPGAVWRPRRCCVYPNTVTLAEPVLCSPSTCYFLDSLSLLRILILGLLMFNLLVVLRIAGPSWFRHGDTRRTSQSSQTHQSAAHWALSWPWSVGGGIPLSGFSCIFWTVSAVF